MTNYHDPPRGTPANIWIYLIFLDTRIIGLYFATDNMGLSLFKFFGWLRKTITISPRVTFRSFKVIQGH